MPADGIPKKIDLQRREMPKQEPFIRRYNFSEVALGYAPEVAVEEARRAITAARVAATHAVATSRRSTVSGPVTSTPRRSAGTSIKSDHFQGASDMSVTSTNASASIAQWDPSLIFPKSQAAKSTGNDAGARADLREVLRRFPRGRFTVQAERLLDEDP